MVGFSLGSGNAHRLYVSGVCAGEWTPMDNTERNKGFSAIVRKFPVGALSMVSPFNFPCAPSCGARLGLADTLVSMQPAQ